MNTTRLYTTPRITPMTSPITNPTEMGSQWFLSPRATGLTRSFMGLPTVAIMPDGSTPRLAVEQGAKAGVGQPRKKPGHWDNLFPHQTIWQV